MLHRIACTTLSAVFLAAVLAAAAVAQEEPKNAPTDVTLTTSDKVQITATYYKPDEPGKDTSAVLLIHGLGGSRVDFHPLAVALQARGYAVLVPDLRGHGESKTVKGSTKTLDWEEMNRADFLLMFAGGTVGSGDIQTCKEYLRERHNAGELNIEKLALIGADFGGVLALNWAAIDWSWRDLPGFRQGKDVKAIFLLSPPWNEKGVGVSTALNHPGVASKLSVYTLVGKQDGARLRDGKKIFNMIEKHHKDPKKDGVYFGELPGTKLRGTQLLHADAAAPQQLIGFLEQHVKTIKSEWEERKNPLESE